MKGTKLFLLLGSISKEELSSLRKAVLSPSFNTNPSVVKLFDTLRKQYPHFDTSPRGKRKLYAKLFPKENYSDGKLRRLFTFLAQVVEKYLILQKISENSNTHSNVLRKVYQERNLTSLFEAETNKELKRIEAQAVKGVDGYESEFNCLMMKYANLHHPKYDQKDDTLYRAEQNLDQYFLLQKLRIAIGKKSREKILKISSNEAILGMPKLPDGVDNPLLELYYQSYFLLTEEQEVNFIDYEQKLKENIHIFPVYDRLLLFYNGLNYLVRLLNRGKKMEEGAVIRWYKWGLSEKYLIQHNRLSTITFGNIVYQGCKAQEFEWVNEFIQTYSIYLKDEFKQDEIAYSRLVLTFSQKRFKEVIFGLTAYQFSDHYILKTKNLKARTYFELFLLDNDYFDLLSHSLKSYENYLYRNKDFSKEHIQHHIYFVHVVKGLMRKYTKHKAQGHIQSWLKEQLISKPTMVSKKWLIDKFLLKNASPI